MPKSHKRKPADTEVLAVALGILPELPPRAGLPSKDSIISVTEPIASSATGAAVTGPKYRIIHTNEMDEYEEGAKSKKGLAAATAALAVAGDKFEGKDRRAAKLSFPKAKTETFKDLKNLIKSLTKEEEMTEREPPITRGEKSNRVKEEKRNVHVKAFIYAASREDDNDYHLIIGRDPSASPEMYMTMELSGLPSSSSASFKKLKAARDAFKKFYDDNLGGKLPGLKYDYPDPPIPVEIDGALFFDITHAKGTRPGPKSLKSRMPVIWEVHPITKMVFES
jgi:hypothetical protein